MAIIGLIELPAFKLLDARGDNWTAFRWGDPLGGKQILAGTLEAGGHEVRLINLKSGHDLVETGSTVWNGLRLTKVVAGTHWTAVDPRAADLWGISVNYLQERDTALDVVRHLATGPAPIVVGGSDALAAPRPYLDAGAAAVVMDKSGAANLPVVNHLLGVELSEPLSGVMLKSGKRVPNRVPPMAPEAWHIPSPHLIQATLGSAYWESPLDPDLTPIGAVMPDLGCDRKCDFCQTPTYRIGYQWMTPGRTRQWLQAQKDAGARSVIVLSDQFLGRTLWKEGRNDVLAIMRIFRELQLPVLWGNGLEVSKATMGRGMRNGDQAPDDELVDALWGWDGHVGCAQAYIPAERPLAGGLAYAKLLTWQNHVAMMKAIVRAGVPDLTYGVIVGLPDDRREDCQALISALTDVRAELKAINPALKFRVVPYAIRPLPGTPQTQSLSAMGLLRFTDPAIAGGFWTACADTHHMSYSEVSEWQHRIMVELSDNEADFQGITGIAHVDAAG